MNPTHTDESGANPSFRIRDSYTIKDYYERSAILDEIMASDSFDPLVYNRTKGSYMTEWWFHNTVTNFCKPGSDEYKRFSTTDFDNNQQAFTWDWDW